MILMYAVSYKMLGRGCPSKHQISPWRACFFPICQFKFIPLK